MKKSQGKTIKTRRKKKKKKLQKQPPNNKMTICKYLSVSNVNQLNIPINRHKVVEWLKIV